MQYIVVRLTVKGAIPFWAHNSMNIPLIPGIILITWNSSYIPGVTFSCITCGIQHSSAVVLYKGYIFLALSPEDFKTRNKKSFSIFTR